MINMKKAISYAFALALMASFNANAALVSSADVDQQELVDGLDPIIAYTLLANSGDATEVAWMNQALEDYYLTDAYEVTAITKLEFDDDAAVDDFWGTPVGTDSEGGDTYTGIIDNNPAHYLVKIGQGKVSFDTFLYRNSGDGNLALASIGLGWLENFSDFTGKKFDIYRLSHVSAVPVPAAFWLFGTALIGLVGISKRRKAA